MSFSSLGLAPSLLKATVASGYAAPTAIQAAAIPAVLAGGDVLAQAQTGSGKTAAFALPLLQRLTERLGSPHQGPRRARALILVPTRELAAQVGAAVTALAAQLPVALKVTTLFGGVSINPQMMGLRGGADIVVATPGRLLDLVDHNALSLAGVAMLVLDEADRLLDLGFSEELKRILALLPATRQTLFFSATYPPAVSALAGRMLNKPLRIDVAAQATDTPDIVQRAIAVEPPRRLQLLKHLILESDWRQVLVFVATKYAAMHVADKLQRNGIDAAAFHGEIGQGGRTEVLRDFKAGKLRVMVATDVAARGIDIAMLPVVVNFDLPRSPVDYTHRIGRTGRAGESGLAVSFVDAETEAHFRLIEKRQAVSVPREVVAGFEPQVVAAPRADAPAADDNGGIKGKRKSKKDKLREAAALVREKGADDGDIDGA